LKKEIQASTQGKKEKGDQSFFEFHPSF
jgi:hypothetical protein